MKKMKRLVAVLLVGIMALAMLTACGAGNMAAPGSDVEKAEALYMDVYNAVLNTNYTNDAELKTKARQILDDSLNEDGTLKSGKKMTVVLDSDNLFVQTAVTILQKSGSDPVPYGITSEELNQMIAHKDETIAEIRKSVGNNMEYIKNSTTNIAVGAVKKGDKTYVAIAMTVDLSKVIQ